jgi:thioredoxin-related protein
MLKNNTFPDPKVGAYYNSKFINVTMDGEKGEGIKLARLMKLTAYPSLYILNSDGELIVHFAGYLKPDEFIRFGQAGLDYLNTMSKKVSETQAD